MRGSMYICCSGCGIVLSTNASVHVQVCTLRQASVQTRVHICAYTLRRVCTCARVCAVCSLALGDESGGFSYSMQGTCCWHGELFLTEGAIEVLVVSSLC